PTSMATGTPTSSRPTNSSIGSRCTGGPAAGGPPPFFTPARGPFWVGSPHLTRAGRRAGGGRAVAARCTTRNPGARVLGAGHGAFADRSDLVVGDRPSDVAVADFNGDGHLDLAVTLFESGLVSILCGNGDGTFGPKADFAVGRYPSRIAAGDLNGDGRPD